MPSMGPPLSIPGRWDAGPAYRGAVTRFGDGYARVGRSLRLVEGAPHQFTDPAERADELGRLDGKQDRLGIGTIGELADRLGIFLGDEVIDRLIARRCDRVRHHLGCARFCFGGPLAGLGIAELCLALAFRLEDGRLLAAFCAKDRTGLVAFRLEDLGYEVEIQNFTTELCEDCRNYIATYEGEDPNSWIVVGGHYDAICYSQQIIIGVEYPGCTSQGAYDDATGASSVLELARLMKQWGGTPQHTWKFATWDYEEWQGSGSPEGAGYGSETFVTTLPEGVEIATYINLDMYGLNWPVETQLISRLSGCDEDYFHLYLFTSPVEDWSYYEDRGTNVTDEMRSEAAALQARLNSVLHDELAYPDQWVVVLDDTKGNSDHYNFISRGWPATWFRGMHEFLQEGDDTCEQSPKHAPTDRVDVLYQLAGGRSGFEAGMKTGLDGLAMLMWYDFTGQW